MHKNKSQKIVYISKNSFEPIDNPAEAYKLTYYHNILYNIESTNGMSFSARMRPTKNKKLEILRYNVSKNTSLCYYLNNDGSIRSSYFEKTSYSTSTLNALSIKNTTLVGEYNRYSSNSTFEKPTVENRAFWISGKDYTSEIKRITGFDSKSESEFNSHNFDISEKFQLNVTFNDFYVSGDYTQKILEIENVIKKIQSNY